MQSSKLLLRTVIVLSAVMLVFILPTIAQPKTAPPAVIRTGGSMALQPPAFFKAAYAQEAEQSVCTPGLLSDAGVMAYIDLQTEIDVTAIASFDSVEEETDQYVIGSFLPPDFETVPDYDEAAYVQVLVCSDGWIVAYQPREQLAAALFDWANYNQRKLKATPLEEAIFRIAEELDMRIPTSPTGVITYYDARYPNATQIKLVADSINGAHDYLGGPYVEDFQLTIPKQLSIYEFSWSHAVLDIQAEYSSDIASSECKLNESKFSGVWSQTSDSWGRLIKAFDNPESLVGKTHTFALTQLEAGNSYCGVAIVYGEVTQ